ncbi:MAG: hypothetical protein ACRY3E_00285 [Candidatus Lariskella arthropodorum]
MQNCLSILGFLDAVYSVLQKSIPYRVLLYGVWRKNCDSVSKISDNTSCK